MSVTTNKKFGLLKGLSDIHICRIFDSAEGYTAEGAPEQLIPAGEMSVGKSIEKKAFYFDNGMFDEIGKEAPSDMSLIGAAVRAAFIAWIEGKTVDSETGAIIDDGDWHNNYYAISGKKDYSDGSSEYFSFLKCSFGGAEEATKTKDDTTDANGATLPFTAYQTIHKFADGKPCKVVRIDTVDTVLKSNADWFAQVVTPTNLSTVCEKVTPPTSRTLTITQATGTTLTVTRDGAALSSGDAIYDGDVLTITVTGGTVKVNGTNFTSGNTHTVTGDVTVVSTKTT